MCIFLVRVCCGDIYDWFISDIGIKIFLFKFLVWWKYLNFILLNYWFIKCNNKIEFVFIEYDLKINVSDVYDNFIVFIVIFDIKIIFYFVVFSCL